MDEYRSVALKKMQISFQRGIPGFKRKCRR